MDQLFHNSTRLRYFTSRLHDQDFEGSSWYLLTALKNENDDFATMDENSVCVICDVSNWSSDDEEICSIVQRGNYLSITRDTMKAITCNYYELNKTQYSFETNILSNHHEYKIKDMYDNHIYLKIYP